MKLTPLILVGLGLWWLSTRNATAAATAVPGYAPSGTPTPLPQETSQNYMDRWETWGLQTGQTFPTMMGYGRTGPLWQSMGMVPKR